MKIEQAKEIAEKAIGQLAESLERGQSEGLKGYLAAMARFPRYSLHNILLIMAQRPGATRVAGYHTWNSLGRQVHRGVKGILIFAPIVRRKEIESSEVGVKSDVKLVGFRGVHVFAEEDTSGQPLPQLSRCQGDPSDYTNRLKAFIASRGIEFRYSESIRPAYGRCSPDRIELLPDSDTAMEFAVLAHEVGHLLLHFDSRRSETTKCVRETEAEAVAFVVCQAIGLEAIRSATEYILLYSGDKDRLAESLEYVQRASTEIITAITAPG
jgi:hypothetical protein